MAHLTGSLRRKKRLRFRLAQKANGRPRLSVARSNKYIYAQLIDDVKGCTLASASSLEKAFPKDAKRSDQEAARLVGKTIAERAKEKGILEVVFDKGAYRYHGRVKALAEAAREVGLSF